MKARKKIRKKTIIISLSIFLLLVTVIMFFFFPTIQTSGHLILNGKRLPEDITIRKFIFENRDDAIIPLVKSYECLGYQSTWESDTVCIIKNENEEYVLDITKLTFVSTKERRVGENLLVPPPGENHGVIQAAEKEVYVNTGVFHGMLLRLGTRSRIHADFWSRQISFDIQMYEPK